MAHNVLKTENNPQRITLNFEMRGKKDTQKAKERLKKYFVKTRLKRMFPTAQSGENIFGLLKMGLILVICVDGDATGLKLE